MKSYATNIPDVLRIFPEKHIDIRGSFSELFDKERYASIGINEDFEKINISISKRHVLRGLHYQEAPHAQAKLVMCLDGNVMDVAVDMRPDSPTYMQHVSELLSDTGGIQLFVPKGFAHGFLVLSERATFLYAVSGKYVKEAERTLTWNDPMHKIKWPIERPILSAKDSVESL